MFLRPQCRHSARTKLRGRMFLRPQRRHSVRTKLRGRMFLRPQRRHSARTKLRGRMFLRPQRRHSVRTKLRGRMFFKLRPQRRHSESASTFLHLKFDKTQTIMMSVNVQHTFSIRCHEDKNRLVIHVMQSATCCSKIGQPLTAQEGAPVLNQDIPSLHSPRRILFMQQRAQKSAVFMRCEKKLRVRQVGQGPRVFKSNKVALHHATISQKPFASLANSFSALPEVMPRFLIEQNILEAFCGPIFLMKIFQSSFFTT